MVRVRQRKSLGFTEFRTGVRVAAYYVYTPPHRVEAAGEDGPPIFLFSGAKQRPDPSGSSSSHDLRALCVLGVRSARCLCGYLAWDACGFFLGRLEIQNPPVLPALGRLYA